MKRRFRKGSATPWAWGITAAAAALTVGVLIGVLAIRRSDPPVADWPPGWPPLPVSATATHGQDSFAIATGQLEDGLDAIYFLDFQTGELRAAALNVRTRTFTAFYQRQILADLGAKDVKNPKFLMVTGVADLQRAAGAQRIGRAVLYVMELNTQTCMAYGVPSVQPRANLSFQGAAPLIPLDKVELRGKEKGGG